MNVGAQLGFQWDEALKIVQRAEDTFNRGDVDAILGRYADDVVIRFAGILEIRGKAAAEKFLRARFARQKNFFIAGRGLDPWLRLIGAAALAEHAVALFYAAIPRYYYLSWFLTMLVVMVWLHQVGIGWLQRRYPDFCQRIANVSLSQKLVSGLSHLQKTSS